MRIAVAASLLLLLVLLPLAACTRDTTPRPIVDARASVSADFKRRYASSRLARWDIRATAAGPDCGVLLVELSTVLDDALVETIHYGSGSFEVYRGGIRDFARELSFRGVVYKGKTEGIWAYDAVTKADAATLVPCR